MKTVIKNGIIHNIYTDEDIAFVRLVWIVIHLAIPYHTYFYPRYTYSPEYGWLN